MAFATFKRLQDVARSYQVSVAIARFVQAQPHAVDERFASDLAFFIQNVDVGISEASVCEFLIAPVLKEVWRAYSDSLLMWSHAPLGIEEPLLGTPDYYFSRRSPLGLVPDQPYVISGGSEEGRLRRRLGPVPGRHAGLPEDE